MQIKTAKWYHDKPSRTAGIWKADRGSENVEQLLIYSNSILLFKLLANFFKSLVYIYLIIQPFHSWIFSPKWLKSYVRCTYTRVFIATLFVTTANYKQVKPLSIHEQINKLSHIYTMETTLHLKRISHPYAHLWWISK